MNKILTIGSAHLDILADYTIDTKDNIDKIGSLKIALGGSAYNIAVNLGFHGFNASILTALRKNSLSGKLIKESLDEKRIDTDYISHLDFIPESGFVAHRLAGKLISAVSSTTIDQVSFRKEILSDAIKNCCLVIIDCNLSVDQMAEIVQQSKNYNKPVMVCSVSESKVSRAIDVDTDFEENYLLFSLNSYEAKKFFTWEDVKDETAVIELCKFYKSRVVAITNGRQGFSIFEASGKRYDFEAPQVPSIKSELGAGDALLAALAAHYVENGRFAWNKINDIVSRFVKPILSIEEGSIGASSAPELSHFTSNPLAKSLFGLPKKTSEPFDAFLLIPLSEPFVTILNDHVKPTLKSINITAGSAGDLFGHTAIMDDIWAGINQAKYIIADCTGRNPNVFYEMGIAHTLGKNTILITQDTDDIPFDISHISRIPYKFTPKGMKELEEQLIRVIESINQNVKR